MALSGEAEMAPMVAIETAGTLPDDPAHVEAWWDNELHPTRKGFKRLVKKAFAPELRNINLT